MIQTQAQVKATIFWSLLFPVLGGLSGCRHTPEGPPVLVLPSKGGESGLLQPGTWVGLPLKEAPYAELRRKITAHPFWGVSSLKDRGEAHMTLITPPEYRALQGKVGEGRLLSALKKIPWSEAQWEPVCVGEARLQAGQRSFFVVVESEDLLRMRRHLWDLLGRPAEFDPELFEPHITLGFTDRDLHRADGIRKDHSSCRAKLQIDGSPSL